MIIDNAVGATVRADMNSALAAIATNNSSATEPGTMYAYQFWSDTTTGLLKQRNSANSAWVTRLVLSEGQLARLNDVSGLISVTSATATDIFGAAGATISIDNSTPVTTTSFTACTSAQVGSVKRVIPVQNWSVTASANFIVDGATSGTYVMPAGAKLEVLASTTTLFQLTTIEAYGSWTPVVTFGGGSTGLTYSTQYGRFTKVGNLYSITVELIFTNKGSSTGVAVLSGYPAAIAQDFCPLITAYNMTVTGNPYAMATVGATSAQIYPINNGAIGAQLTDAAFANNTVFRFVGTYQV
jgi:hypothetical protein